MTEKENALRIIRFDHPDHIAGSPPGHPMGYFGCNHESFDGGSHNLPVGSHWTDIWGTTWYKEHPGVMGFPRGHPLADPAALKTYRWPDPDDPRLCQPIYDQAASFTPTTDAFLTGSHRDTLWEKAYMLVGMENMMEYFFSEPNYTRDILHHIMDFQLGMARHYLKNGIELASCSDDLGTQIGPLLGPDLTREFLVPEYRRLFALYHQHHVLINFHSCGHVESLIPIFLDLGIHILNPVQATANNLDTLRALTHGKIALMGGVSSGTLVAGPIDAIIRETRHRIDQLGAHGGYFCAPDQHMPWPQAHLDAFYQTVATYGRYSTPPQVGV